MYTGVSAGMGSRTGTTSMGPRIEPAPIGGFLMSPPCMESQGCQFDPTFLYLLSCSLPIVLSLFLSYPLQLLSHSPDLFFPKPPFSER